jgi:molecular chaperone GrpE
MSENTVNTDTFEKSDTVQQAGEAAIETPVADLNTPELPEAESELDELRSRVAALEDELKHTQDHLYRKAAEMENMRKRHERDRQMLFQSSRIDAIRNFLAVNDDLIRTLTVAGTLDVQPVSFLEGVQMVAGKFQQVLAGYNVQLIAEENVPFDVHLHEAMMRQPAPEGMGENMVVKVFEPGYKMGDTVIRHAKVIVTQ